MAKLTDLYAQLKSSIIGTKTQKTDAALDKAVNDIIGYKSNSGRNGYIDLVRTVIAKSTTGMGFGGGNSLYSQSQTGPAGFGQGMRLMRYKTYEAIVYNISYAYRALSVLVDNILSPDDITKISLDVKPKSYIESESTDESNVKRVKDIISGIKLEERLPLIVRGSLLYGDFFCEIAPPKIALTSKSIINESGGYNDYINNQIKLGIKQSWTEKFNINRKEVNFKVSIDYSSFMESMDEKNVDKNNKIYNLTLVLHKPNRVVKLQSSLFPVCFGYLVFPDMTALSVGSGALEDQPVNNLCMNILRNLQDKIPQMAEFQNNKELKDLIKYMIKQTDPSQALEIRYVPPDKMTHFHPPSSKYYPYGESIFDSSQYLAKVLIALETALAVQRLSRSTEKRKIAIEVGLPRDARKAIENMKEEFRKRKVSLDSFGTVDTIPCLALDTKISMANGFSMKLEDIIDQFTNGNRNMFVYSYDFNTGKVFPNRIVNAKISGRNVDVIKITLDNGKFEYCTSDHRWMLRNGQYKKAEDLQPGDSLMPLYRRNNRDNDWSYEEVYHPGNDLYSGSWQLTHRSFSEYLDIVNEHKPICHHIDKNPRNNHPDNLRGVNNSEHAFIHINDMIDNRGKDKIYVNRECPYCGELYISLYHPLSQTCGEESCIKQSKVTGGYNSWIQRKHLRKYKIVNEPCDWCGELVKISISVLERKRSVNVGIFCNKKNCNLSSRSLARRTKMVCEIQNIVCEICGEPTIYSNDRFNLPVCSYICSQTLLSRRRWKDNKIKNRCDWCGNIYECNKSSVKNNKFNSCSSEKCKKSIRKLNHALGNLKRNCNEIYYDSCKICGEEFITSECSTFQDRYVARSKGFCNIKCVNKSKRKSIMNHKVVKVEKCSIKMDVGDIEVEKFHNFGLESGVFIHNSMITTFEDVYIPQKDGKPFVDISTFNEGSVDVRSKTDELKFMRDSLTATWNVPPSFLGIEENLSNKNALSEENILFARAVIGHQKYLSHQLSDLVKKVFDIIDPESSMMFFDNIDLHLPTPKSLQFERESRSMNEIVGLIESLDRIGIPKEFSKRKYLANFDWAEIKKYTIDQKVEQSLDPSKKDDDLMNQGVGGGGFGGSNF